MQQQDGLIEACLARNPRSIKRMREFAFEEVWASPLPTDPDYSALPKDVWGMIVARCEATRPVFTRLLLINKQRISPIVWKHFRFPKRWHYEGFVHRLLLQNVEVARPDFWALYGFDSAEPMVEPIIPLVERHIAWVFWQWAERRDAFDSCLHNSVMLIKTKTHIRRCLSRLFKLYHPPSDAYFICLLMCKLGYEAKGPVPARWEDQENIAMAAVPHVFTSIRSPVESTRVILGYYYEYAAHAKKDFAIVMPKLKSVKNKLK
jgi:hypothetical protein